MKTYARWILLSAAALLLVPSSWGGGNDTPAVPPANTRPVSPPLDGTVSLTPTLPACEKAVAAGRTRALWIGVLKNGVVLNHYRSVIPMDSLAEFLESLLDHRCR